MKSKNKKKAPDKLYKFLKGLSVFLILFLIIEVVYFGIKFYENRKNTVYYDIVNSIKKVDDGYVAVGLSDFKNSKLTSYKKPGYNKGVIALYNDKLDRIKETAFKLGFNSVFNSVTETEDGFVAVGSVEVTKAHNKEGYCEALIVKYNKNLEEEWFKNIKILDINKLMQVKTDKDGNIIVVGQSIYGPNYIGNHTTGGAILIKFDKEGEELLRINLGGPQTDIFNDFIIEEDGYVVVGIKGTGTGIIYKYDLKAKELWHEYYGYTDKEGLVSITKFNNNYVVTGSLLPEKDSTDKYKGAIIIFDKNGKKVKEEIFEEDNITKIQKITVDNDKIIALGIYGKKEKDILKNNSFMLILDKDLKVITKEKLTGNKTVNLTDVIVTDKEYIVSGYTDSKLEEFKTNGYDYFPFIKKYGK